MTAPRALAALALAFALAHVPFLAHSLEDIDSVNFALGVRDFDVAEHRPHPPGYPLYIAIGKVGTAVAGALMTGAPASTVEARALAGVSLLAGLMSIALLYGVFASLGSRSPSTSPPRATLHLEALAATVVTVSCPLFWYLAARPMSDLPGLAAALAAQACLMLAWWRQGPGPDGDRRLSPALTAASGRMIVLGSLLAALSIGMRSQTVWFTLPLLVLVLLDRVGRGVAGAMIGGGIMFVVGGLAWGIPLLVASGGLGPYLAALGTQAGEDFAGGEMLYTNPSPRAVAFALMRTFIDPWDSPALGVVVLALAALGIVRLAMRDRRTLAAIVAMSAPYLVFHLAFQDTSFVRYALPLVPPVAFLAMRGAAVAADRGVAATAGAISLASLLVASPVLAAYGSEPSPTVRVLAAMNAATPPGAAPALAMHQTFKRPLEAEEIAFATVLPSPPRLEWLELAKFWRDGRTDPIWFLADPLRSDLALIDPASRADFTELRWPLVARPAFGGMRPSAVRWYRMPAPGWYAEEGWSLTPETSGMAALMGRGPHLGPITAQLRRRPGAAAVMVGGRNLAGPGASAARFTLAIDGVTLQQWEAAPGFFLHVFDIPAGRLMGDGAFARLTIQSNPVSGTAEVRTAIEQFDLQGPDRLMWGYGDGWNEAEYNNVLGVWRWTSERATLRIAGPSQDVRIALTVESPLRYFEAPAAVRVRAGDREIAATTLADTGAWAFTVPAAALAASGGMVTIETDRTFVPAERGGGADNRRLGLRILAIDVANSLTPAEVTR
ncbi:MAG: DUF2723 domain-containing protein [Vicinamibacterales bacterium]